MLTAILVLLYLSIFIAALKRPEVAIAILTFFQCTIEMPYLNVNLGPIGTFAPADFIVFSLAINFLSHRFESHSRLKFIVKAIIIWLLIAVFVLFFIEKNQDIKFIYNYVIRYALLWLVPIFIINFTERQKIFLVKALYVTIYFVVAVQIYSYLTLDFDFITTSYYQYTKSGSFEIYGGGVEEELRFQLTEGLPRLYPAGTALCLAMLGYTLAEMLSKRVYVNQQLLMCQITFGSLLFFLVTLRGRAPIFGLAVIVALVSGNFLLKKSAKRPGVVNKQTIMILLSSFILTAVITALQQIFGFSFITHLFERLNSFDIAFFFDTSRSNRAMDSFSALNLISEEPIFGIGTPSLPLSAQSGSAIGLDVHPVLSAALLFGTPYILLIFVYIKWSLQGLFALNQYDFSGRAFTYGVPVLYLLLLALLNSVQVFSTDMHLIPFLIFTSLCASEIMTIKSSLITYSPPVSYR